ncbi:hypothetical protein DYB26_005754 [Aphanomyces astaci]|uniref:Rad60/SUMO-like domain-containing protein n=1 Tax=Aphanomyces astaci TaxID=112090 RepID=A0A3R7C969_APHAT|nr:hypothetical protein DYB34_002909 [Aphanomyces astaci]RHZ18982.1 hypothetical protein DYB26_005754 [Aphanomyces astaci]
MFSNQVMPVANVICARREIKHQVDMLYENLQSPKGLCNITSPRTFSHLQFNAKKHTQAQAQQARIDHDNTLLMEKMAHIMISSSATTNTSFKPGTCLDRNQLPKIDNHNNYTLVHGYAKTRQREAQRIAKENALHRQRIDAQKPTYTNAQYNADNAAKNVHLSRMHRKLVWSKPTRAELKQEERREAAAVTREVDKARVYASPTPTVPGANADIVSPVARNRMCICIDGFDPSPPLVAPSGRTFPQSSTGGMFPRPPRKARHTALPSKEVNKGSEEIDLILQENEEALVPCPISTPSVDAAYSDTLLNDEYESDMYTLAPEVADGDQVDMVVDWDQVKAPRAAANAVRVRVQRVGSKKTQVFTIAPEMTVKKLLESFCSLHNLVPATVVLKLFGEVLQEDVTIEASKVETLVAKVSRKRHVEASQVKFVIDGDAMHPHQPFHSYDLEGDEIIDVKLATV